MRGVVERVESPSMLLATCIFLIVSLAVLIASTGGIVLCFAGLRGRLIDDHPLCRRCGYDLIGHAQRPYHCPECGSDTTLPDAVKIGRRNLSRSRLLAGVSLIILSSTPFTLSGCLGAPGSPLRMAPAQSAPTATLVTP